MAKKPGRMFVQVLSVGVPIHQRPFEAQLRHCAFQFTRRLFGVLHGQRGEAGQSRWMAPNQVRSCIIERFRCRDGGGGIGYPLNAGTGEGEDLNVHAVAIHFR